MYGHIGKIKQKIFKTHLFYTLNGGVLLYKLYNILIKFSRQNRGKGGKQVAVGGGTHQTQKQCIWSS